MVTACEQICVLLWKDIKLKQRRPISTLIELLAPLVIISILIGIRQSQDFLQRSSACQFKPSPLASRGLGAVLRSFCHLGVCREGAQTFHAEQVLVNDEGFRNISRVMGAINFWLNHSTIKKLSLAASATGPALSDPTKMKKIRLRSLFKNNGSGLFDGVKARKEQRAAFETAEVPFPKLLDLSMSPGLAGLMKSQSGLPNILCSGAGATANWTRAVRELCKQPRFRENLRSQLDFDAVRAQMASTDSSKRSVLLNHSDLKSLQMLLSQINEINNDGTLLVFQKMRDLAVNVTEGLSSGRLKGWLQSLKILVSQVCGPGKTVLSDYLDREMVEDVAEDFEPNEIIEKSTNDSEKETVNLTTIVPPEEFCSDKRYRNAILLLPDWLLDRIGLSGLKRLMFGEILFYPETERTLKFLKKLNETLIAASWASYVAENFVKSTSPRIANFITNSSEMTNMRPQSQEATSASGSASATVDSTEGQLQRAHEAFVSAFPDAVLCENHAAVLQYQLKQTVRLRTIFESVQRLKDNGLVLDYSVNQTTLDQVFINFAKNQSEMAT